MNVVSVLPREVEAKLAEFLAAGKTGSVSLHINSGCVLAWEIRETGKVPHT